MERGKHPLKNSSKICPIELFWPTRFSFTHFKLIKESRMNGLFVHKDTLILFFRSRYTDPPSALEVSKSINEK